MLWLKFQRMKCINWCLFEKPLKWRDVPLLCPEPGIQCRFLCGSILQLHCLLGFWLAIYAAVIQYNPPVLKKVSKHLLCQCSSNVWPWQFNKNKVLHINTIEWLVLSFVRLNTTFERRRKKSQQNLESAKSKLIQCCFYVPGVNPRERDARNILVTQHKAGPLSVRGMSDCCQTGSLLVGQHCLPCSQHTHTWDYTKPSHKPTMFLEDILHPYLCEQLCKSHTFWHFTQSS